MTTYNPRQWRPERVSVDATCVHGLQGRCTTCLDLANAPSLPTEGMYKAPKRDGEVLRKEATGTAYHGPRPERPYSPGPVQGDRATLERMHAAAAERERTRAKYGRHGRIEPAECHATVAPQGEAPPTTELDTYLADWAERLGVTL